MVGIRSFLFENRGIRQALLKNTFWISLSEGFGKALRALLMIYIARFLGPTEYGVLNFAMSFVALFVSFLDFGLASIITRELAADGRREADLPALLSLKACLTAGTVLMIWLGSFFITPDPAVRTVVQLLALFSALTQFPEFFYAFWRARQRMEYEAWTNIGHVSLVMAVTLAVIARFPNAWAVSSGYLLCSLATLVVVAFFFYSRFQPPSLIWDTRVWKRYLLLSYPLALTSIFGMLYSYVDSILMGYLGQITQTGLYHGALKIIYVILTPVGILSLSFFPVLSKFSRESVPALQRAMNVQMGISLAMAVPLICGGVALAPGIIHFLYGPAYAASARVLQILLFMAGLACFCTPLSNLLIANHQQGKIFWVGLTGSVVSVGLNFWLIPRFSLYGAASVAVISYAVMFLLYLYLSRRFTPVRFFNSELLVIAGMIVLAAAAMLLVITRPVVASLHVLLAVSIGAGTYLGTLLLLVPAFHRLNPGFWERFAL
ncbi:MAG: flippase [Syntrophaceae bacterium]|nr:flippase [Syntrophaceae bacterium]